MRPADAVALAQLRSDMRSGVARQLRLDLDLSLAEMGAAAGGLPPSTISRWERDKQTPHGPAALRYARVLARLRASVNVVESAS